MSTWTETYNFLLFSYQLDLVSPRPDLTHFQGDASSNFKFKLRESERLVSSVECLAEFELENL